MWQGFACGLASSASFGLIPLFTLPLIAWGMGTPSILFYRFCISSLLMAVVLVATRRPLLIPLRDIARLGLLGLFYASAAITFFYGFYYMDSGVVATLQFVCPVFVVLFMILFFHEKARASTFLAMGMCIVGVAFLSLKPEGVGLVSLLGLGIVLLSALLNALYITGIQITRLSVTSGLSITFYLMLFGALYTLLFALGTGSLAIPTTAQQWGTLALLGAITGVFSTLMLVAGVKRIGSTITSVLGAMEPVTALVVGVWVFDESFTWRSFCGATLIISAVLIIMLAPYWQKKRAARLKAL
jgi:drug/metabolite transporter (DMT)-like permease